MTERLTLTESPADREADESVIARIRSGSDDAMELIVHRYKPLVLSRARSYFLIGADHDDLVQEGMIGLFKAVRDYRDERNIAFRMFAEMCVVRQMISAVKAASRLKHQPLNSYVSLSRHAYDDESDRSLMEKLSVMPGDNPENLFIRSEEMHVLNQTVERLLSPFERQVLALYLDGIAYSDIADRLEKPTKAIDNALQRIRRKIEQHACSNTDAVGG